jgi:cytochrome c oxidase subunit 2
MLSARRMSLMGRIARLMTAGLFAVTAGTARADYALNLPTPVTDVAEKILDLHNGILVLCFVIFLVVFGVMMYSIVMHRKSRGHKAATFHDSAVLEVIWTIVPFIILVVMAIPSTAYLLDMEDTTSDDPLTVNITGYQWKWKYEFPDQNLSFFSTSSTPPEQIANKQEKGEHYLYEVDNPLVLPVGKKVRFVLTANDVIHSWWMPQFGVKKDAIPGFLTETWTKIREPGIYRGTCAELCGKGHAYMPIVVHAVSPEEFDKWIVAQKDKIKAEEANAANRTFTKEELIERGGKVYAANCAVCHGVNGEGSGTVFPKMAGSPVALGPMAAHVSIVMNGKPGTAMQAFGPQLSDLDIAAVISFERHAFGNNAGDIIQPAQIKAARKR